MQIKSKGFLILYIYVGIVIPLKVSYIDALFLNIVNCIVVVFSVDAAADSLREVKAYGSAHHFVPIPIYLMPETE